MPWISTRRAIAPLLLLLAAPGMLGASDFDSDFATRLLAGHNRERAALGLAPLRWSDELADGAGQWAGHLASTGQFRHSPNDQGQRIGENIWGGTPGQFTPERMVGLWLAEKQFFKNGVFPANSTSGNSRDVGHYTQIIWRRSTEVGCSLARGRDEDILVCRYATAGNVWGQSPL